jgi:hypothetical protein
MKIESKDGTVIAFDQIGEGRPIILVAGASCDRAIDTPIADALARSFTVLNYDRRGRGDSCDTPPYSVAREVEDIRALLEAAGGSATVLACPQVRLARGGGSGLPIAGLIMGPTFQHRPGWSTAGPPVLGRLTELLAADRRVDALVHHDAIKRSTDDARR